MKLLDAIAIIASGVPPRGPYRVAYVASDGRIAEHGCFPDHSTKPQEPGIEDLDQAWALAEAFAAKAPAQFTDIKVVGRNYKPVEPGRVLRPTAWSRSNA